jgi:Domain of unknown function (DUF4288)
MKDEIPYRNRSRYGWWIGSYLERAIWNDKLDPPLNSRCIAWENTVLIQAANRDEAYSKLLIIAKTMTSEFENELGRKGHWVFEGLTSLLPVYEELNDGAEILWIEHKNKSIGKIKSLIKKKEELEAFDDTQL